MARNLAIPHTMATAMLTMALAGCLAPAETQPLDPAAAAGTVGGSSTLPEIVAQGAEVVLHPDAVELVWTGTAPLRAPLPGLPLAGSPLPATFVRHPLELPPEVTLVEASLAWETAGATLSVVVRNDEGRTQCRGLPSADEPGRAWCRFHAVGERGGPWPLLADVLSNAVLDPAGVPFELRLNLSVRPFPLLGPALAPELRSPALEFRTVRVDEERRTGEPSLKVDGQGNVYVAAPTGRMQTLWRTSDGGATFEVLDMEARGGPTGQAWSVAGRGGGDAEVFVTPDGREVYFADLYGTCFTVAGSLDAGASWHVNPLSCEYPVGNDRQWLWAHPGGHLWMNFNAFTPGVAAGLRGAHTLLHSIDGGLTWPFRLSLDEDRCARGNLAVDAEGRVYAAGCNDDGPGVAVVEPASFDYAWHTVAERRGEAVDGFCHVCGIFTVLDLDTEGNPYVVWADPSEDGAAFDVWLASSRDRGATWSAPAKVNRAEGQAILPWVAAGEPGHVVVAWYQTADASIPNEAAGEWYVHVAESTNALDAEPAFAEALLHPAPVQYGPVCLRGSACTSARNLLDFLMVDIDARGRAHVAFNDGSWGGSAGNSLVMYGAMVRGLAAPSPEPAAGPAAAAPALRPVAR